MDSANQEANASPPEDELMQLQIKVAQRADQISPKVRTSAAGPVRSYQTARIGGAYSVPGKAPPSSRIFWPVMKPAFAPHKNAQARPNSSGSPNRPAGLSLARSTMT